MGLLALSISRAWLILVCPRGSEPLLVCLQNPVLEITKLSTDSGSQKILHKFYFIEISWETRNSSGNQNNHLLVNTYSRYCHLILKYRFVKPLLLSFKSEFDWAKFDSLCVIYNTQHIEISPTNSPSLTSPHLTATLLQVQGLPTYMSLHPTETSRMGPCHSHSTECRSRLSPLLTLHTSHSAVSAPDSFYS